LKIEVTDTRERIADFDGDGRPDVATANFTSANEISVLLNTSAGTNSISFAPHVELIATGFPSSVTTGDFDFDGDPTIHVQVLWLPAQPLAYLNSSVGQEIGASHYLLP